MTRPPDETQRRSTGRGLLPVGRFFGVPLYFAPSWVLIAALITATYGGLVRDVVPDIGATTATLVAFGYAVLLALCVLAHELGHTAVSLALHRPVRRVVIFLLGGVSELEGDPVRARDELLISLAGPLTSLVIAAAAFGGTRLTTDSTIAWTLLVLLTWSNLIVAVFNLLPGLPLDGGRVLRAAVWGISRSRLRGTVVAAWGGRVIAVAVVAAAVFLDRGSYNVANALVGVALAAFIWFGATQALRAAQLEARMPSLDVRRLMRPGIRVSWDTSVAEAMRRAWASQARGVLVVDSADRPRALLEEARVRTVPSERRAWVPVGDVARPLEDGLVLSLEASGEQVVAALQRTPAAEYLVVHPDGSPAGILAAADVTSALRTAGPVPAGQRG